MGKISSKIFFFIFVLAILFIPQKAHALSTEFEYQLDAYYTAADWNINLTSCSIPTYTDKTEAEIYKILFLSSPIPHQVVIEASVNPLPLGGVLIRDHAPALYRGMNVHDQNLIRSGTAGFEEPAALSLFFGNMINFKPVKKHNYGEGRGYLGYLFSAGTQHIKDNELVEDKWLEGEWKIKGDRILSDVKLKWSFRVGAKYHTNRDIADVLYVGLRRSRIDFHQHGSFWMRNSGFSYKYDFGARTVNAIQHELILSKKFPLEGHKWVPTLDVGFTYQERAKYSGALRDNDRQKFLFLFQPNIEF